MEGNKVNIILADDHSVIRQALAEVLSQINLYSVVAQACDGRELLKTLPQHSETDVVIMDMNMPVMTGIEAIAKMRENGQETPVLILSAHDGAKDVRAALHAGANGFLPKNAELDELQFAIRSVLSGKTYLSPTITTPLIVGNQKEEESENALRSLTKRESEIFKMLAEGKANRDIAKELFISVRTVDTHRTNILKKLNVKSNVELAKLAISSGMIDV